jgi:small subunit ribosomal protein S7
MLKGKKTVARSLVYGALKKFAEKVKSDPMEAFHQALENAKPSVEVRSKRLGGATYPVPVEIAPNRREAIGMRWMINFARAKVGVNMEEGLCMELVDCYHNQGSTIKKRDDTHRMAEANRAFAHIK